MTAQSQKPLRVANGKELDDVLAEHDRVLVEFYTKGCAMCQAIEPVLGNVAREFNSRAGNQMESDDVARETGITIAMVNPGDDIGLVDEWNVLSVPTLVLVEDGEEVARLAEGFQGGAAIEEFLDEHA